MDVLTIISWGFLAMMGAAMAYILIILMVVIVAAAIMSIVGLFR